MDFCAVEVPLNHKVQKDRLLLVAKGSLSNRRKPSRYSNRPRLPNPITEWSRFDHCNGDFQTTSVECNSKTVLDSVLDHQGSTEVKRVDPVLRKSAVLIQTWERRSQITENLAKKVKGQLVKSQSESKPLSTMPAPLTNGHSIAHQKCNGTVQLRGQHNGTRLTRPKSMGHINGSLNEEPEWISLSRKLCAKFVQSHLDAAATKPTTNGEEQKHEISISRRNEIPPKTIKVATTKKSSRQKLDTNGISPEEVPPKGKMTTTTKYSSRQKLDTNGNSSEEVPPWIDLSRKLCNKFIEEHIECEPIELKSHRIPQNTDHSINGTKTDLRIVEKVGRKEFKEPQRSKDEPEWVTLSRRLRAKFIEGHRDDPDTMSLDNQLNASDLEEYRVDAKSSSTQQNKTFHSQNYEHDKQNGGINGFHNNNNDDNNNNKINSKNNFNSNLNRENHSSSKGFCYWSDLASGEKSPDEGNIHRMKVTYEPPTSKKNGHLPKNLVEKRPDFTVPPDKCSTPRLPEENGTEFNFESNDEVNYNLDFESFETEPKTELHQAPFVPNGKIQSKSLCDLSQCDLDSLEYHPTFTKFGSIASMDDYVEQEDPKQKATDSLDMPESFSCKNREKEPPTLLTLDPPDAFQSIMEDLRVDVPPPDDSTYSKSNGSAKTSNVAVTTEDHGTETDSILLEDLVKHKQEVQLQEASSQTYDFLDEMEPCNVINCLKDAALAADAFSKQRPLSEPIHLNSPLQFVDDSPYIEFGVQPVSKNGSFAAKNDVHQQSNGSFTNGTEIGISIPNPRGRGKSQNPSSKQRSVTPIEEMTSKDSVVEYIYSKEHIRSVELPESNPGKKKKSKSYDLINGRRESLKEFDVANESYQAINPPFEFDAFDIPMSDSLTANYANRKRIESSDSETTNSTPFDARTLVSPSSCASDSDASSWTLTKNGRNGDYSDCSMSVRCNDTPNCSNQSTLDSRISKTNESDIIQKPKNKAHRFSEVFVDCETTKNWKKTRSLDQLDETHIAKNGPHLYANIQEKEPPQPPEGNDATMPESLRHLFNIPMNNIFTPSTKTSMLLSKTAEPLPIHYFSSVPLSSSLKTKPKTERSSSVKIKDIAQGIILTFRKFHSHSKSSSISASQYVDVSHLAEANGGQRKVHQCSSTKELQDATCNEYGKLRAHRSTLSTGYFANRSTSETNLFSPSKSQLCTCKDLHPAFQDTKPTKESSRPKSFNFGMLSDAKKSKSHKKTSEMKEKKSKSHNGKSKSKKLDQGGHNSSVSRKVQQMADGTLCLVTTVSGDTTVPGVYSDSQDTGSEISSHGVTRRPGESNC